MAKFVLPSQIQLHLAWHTAINHHTGEQSLLAPFSKRLGGIRTSSPAMSQFAQHVNLEASSFTSYFKQCRRF
jgi:hypothetical protein